MKLRSVAILLVSGLMLSGCASMPGWLGGKKTDDTVLPGEREEVLPAQKLPKGNTATASRQGALSAPDATVACETSDPNYPDCLTPDEPGADVPAIDEESTVPQQ